MSGPMDIPETWLHAFLDGELSEDRNTVEHAVAADAELAQRLALYRADKDRLAATYGRVLNGPVPASWVQRIERHATPWHTSPSIRALAAAVAFFAVLLGGTLLYRQQMAPHGQPIVEEALAARDNTLASHKDIAVRSPADAAAASRVLASTLAMRLKAPDLSRMGYQLASVQIYDRVPGGKAVQLVYRQRDNREFAVYVRNARGAARFDEFTRGQMRVCIWQDEVVGTVMSGQMSAAEMQRLAALAYSGLES